MSLNMFNPAANNILPSITPAIGQNNADESAKFLRILFKSTEGWLVLFCAGDSRRETHAFPTNQIDEAVSKALSIAETHNVYFGLALQNNKPEWGKRGTAAGACCIPGFWIELDIAGLGHKSTKYFPTQDDALRIINLFPLPPSILVHSGGGIHVYWLFSEPWILSDEEERKKAGNLCKGLQATIRSYAAEYGWKVDSTGDLARVLRVPGTYNLKEENNPRPVTILEMHDDRRYSPEDFEEHLIDLPEAKKSASRHSNIGQIAPVQWDQPPADVKLILEHCAWFRSTKVEAAKLQEPEWYEQQVILNHCNDGAKLAHEFSCEHPKYSESETTAKFAQASGYSPRTCKSIQTEFTNPHCANCRFKEVVKMPIQLGDTRPAQKATVDIALALIELKNDASVVFTPETLEAFSLLQREQPHVFQKMRTHLKGTSASIGQFDKALNAHVRNSFINQGVSPYRIENNVLCLDKPTSQGVTTVMLSNFAVTIDKEVTRDDGSAQDKTFRLSGKVMSGELLPTIEVTAAEFCNTDWVLKRYGAKAICFQTGQNHLRAAIQSCSDNIQYHNVYTHTGWRKENGAYLFLSATGGIGENGLITDVEVDLGNNSINQYALPEPPTGQEAKDAVEASLKLLSLVPPHVAYPLLGTLGRAPLCEAHPADLSVFLAGYTGAGKSEVAAIVQRHFGSGFDGKNLPANWSSTANSLEKLAYMTKDCLMVADDFIPKGTSTEIAKMHGIAEKLLRGQANRAGRQRMNSDGSLRQTFFPRGIILSTGEDVPRGQSLMARILILQLSPKDVDFNVLTALQDHGDAGQLAEAMSAYLQWLAPRLDNLKKTLPTLQKEYRSKALKLSAIHGRTPDMVASLMVGIENYIEFAINIETIPQTGKQDMLDTAWDNLMLAAQKQGSIQKSECPVHKYFELLTSALQSGQAHLTATNDGCPSANPALWGWADVSPDSSSPQWLARGTKIGWIDGSNAYLLSGAAYGICQKMAQQHGMSIGVGEKTLNKHLKDKGKVVAWDKGSTTTRKRIGSTRKRVLHLNADELGGQEQTTKAASLPIQIFNNVII